MNNGIKSAVIGLIALGSTVSLATVSPKYLITHNQTNEQSNAYIDGTMPSPFPTAANTDGTLSWNMVRLACYGHSKNNICRALIKMATNTPNPVDIGFVEMNVNDGNIEPKELSANGYTITVNGPGEVTLTPSQ